MSGISCRSSDRKKKPKKYHEKPNATTNFKFLPNVVNVRPCCREAAALRGARHNVRQSNLGLVFSVFLRFFGLHPPPPKLLDTRRLAWGPQALLVKQSERNHTHREKPRIPVSAATAYNLYNRRVARAPHLILASRAKRNLTGYARCASSKFEHAPEMREH